MVRGVLEALAVVVSRRVDVVDLHLSKGLSVLRKGLVVAVARTRGVPTVVHAHAGAFAGWFDGLPRPLRGLVRRALRPDRLVVLSDEAREVYAERLRVPRSHIVVAANPVEIPVTPPSGTSTAPSRPSSWGGSSTTRACSTSSRRSRWWTPPCANACTSPWRATATSTPSSAGSPSSGSPTMSRCGRGSPAERDALLGRAQLLVLPSWWEALPMAVLEGMAWAVTPVVTPVGALATLVRDGHNGAVVPLQDPPALAAALEKLLVDDEQRARLGAAARNDVAGYGTTVWAEDLVELYTGLVGLARR